MSKKGKSSNKYRKVVINNENIEKRNRFEKKKIFILIAFLLVLTLGSSYAVLTQVLTSNSKIVSIKSGVFKIDFEDGNKINLNNASPMTDEEGLNTDSYDFTISNTGNVDAKYTVLLEEKDNNTLDKKYIKYSIKKDNGSYSTPAYLSEGIVLERELGLRALESATYSLKIWLDNDADNSVQGKTFNARIVVNSVQDMSDLSDVESPIIKLNGDTELTLLKNTQFIDPGVLSVTDNKDNNLQVTKTYEYYNNGDTTSVEGVDTSVLGVYYIYYEAVDSEGNVGRSVRIINVVENEEKVPTITLLGDSNVYLKKGQDYIESGYTATDGEYDVTEKVIVEGKVNTNKAGVYTIKYLLELDNGETVSTTRTVTVEAVGVMTISNKTPVYRDKYAEVEITISSTEDKIEGYLITNSNTQPAEKDFVEIKNPSKTYTWKEKFNKNGTYYVWGLDSEKNIEQLEITISNLDDTIPECTLEGEQTISIPNEEEITLTCTDSSGIEEKYLTDKHFEINDNIEITNISAPEAVTNGYKYIITLNGKTAGNSSISLKKGIISDIAGNKNNRTTKNITVELLEFTVTYNYSENGGTSSTKTTATVTYGSSIDLTPTATKSGWTFVGWNTNKDATTKLSTLTMSNSNVVLYAIYRKEAVTYTATFDKNGASSIGQQSISCTIDEVYNNATQSTSCSPTDKVPSITASANTPTIVGFSTNKNATTADVQPNDTLTLTENIKYYAITKANEKTLTATFDGNNGTLSKTSVSCTIGATYNGAAQDATCSIKTPTATAPANTPTILGYATSSNATSASIGTNADLTISGGEKYYLITRKDAVTYTATYTKGSNVSEIGKTGDSCTIAATYNGTAQDSSCSITSPSITAATGYSASGWYSGDTKVVNASTSFSLSDNMALVAKAEANIYHVTLNNQNGTTSGTTDAYYQYNTTKEVNGVTCYYYTTSALTTCLTSGYYITNPTKTGYSFKGYYTETSGGGTQYVDSNGSFVNNIYKTVGDRTLYANWVDDIAPTNVTLTNSSGGDWTNQNVTVAVSAVDKGSGIEKFQIKYSGTDNEWRDCGGSVTTEETTGTITDRWSAERNETAYYRAVDAAGNPSDPISTNIRVDKTKPSCTWSDLPTLQTNGTGTATLTCTDSASGVVSKNLATTDFTTTSNGQVTAVSAPVAVTNGYKYTVTLKGLSVGTFTASLKAGSISDNATNTNDIATSSNVTVNGLTYTANFSASDNAAFTGSTALSCTTTGSNTSCSITLPTITPETGYSEDGWYLGTTKVGKSGDSYSLSGNVTLTTKSSINSYTATFDGNGGTNGSSITREYGQQLGTLPSSSRTGYTFAGWFTESSGGSQISSTTTMPLNGKTYYAHWLTNVTIPTAASYCAGVTYNGGSQTITKDPATGYTFSGNSGTNAGSYTVTASLSSGYAWSDSSTSNKTFSCSIAQRATTCTSGSDSKTYDGSALTSTNTGSCTNLVSGHSATFSGHTGTITNAGSTANTFGSVVIKSGTTDVSSNYSITKANGTLTVNQAKTATTGSCGSYTYDGGSKTLASGGSYVSYSNNTRTDAGSQNVTVTTDSNHQFSDGSESKTLSCSISQRATTCTSGSDSKTYDGSALTSTNTGSCTNLVSGHSATFSGHTGSITNAGSTANTFGSVVIKSGTTDVSSNYAITKSTGTLTVNKANISPTVSMSGYQFAGTKSTPSISGNTGNGTVTYYYNTTNSNSNGTAWSNVSNSSSLAVGTYYMYAVVGATDNYNGATTATKSFTISGITRTETFYPNGNTISTPSGCSKSGNNVVCSCTTTGTNTSCSITSPTIAAPSTTPTVIGFSTGETTRTNSWSSNTSTSVSGNGSYYAQTTKAERTNTAIFDGNNGTLSKTSVSCTIGATYNGTTQGTTCSIKTPTVSSAPANTPTVLGYSTSSSATSASIGTNADLTISGGEKYYLITKKDAVTYTASYTKGSNVSEIGKTTDSCTIAATYNGTAQDSSCSVTSPSITTVTGYSAAGWYSGDTKVVDESTSYNLSSSVSLTAKASVNSYAQDLNYVVDGTCYYSGYQTDRIKVGLKIGGVDKGYVADFGGTYNYGTAYEIYGVQLDGVTLTSYNTTGTIGTGNMLNLTFYTLSVSSNNTSYGTVSPTSIIAWPGETYSTNSTTLRISDGRTVSATINNATGYTTNFTGWSNTSGTFNSALSTTANFSRSANQLNFSDQTITKTFSTSSQTASITGASNGTGTYTYSEVSEKNSSSTSTNYISISGTTITLAANTPASTYTYVVRATDSNSSVTKDATYTIIVNKASITPTVSMTGYTYGGTKSTPSVSGNTGSGGVTYYYNTTNSNSNGTAWSNVTSSTSLKAGTYYMYAVVDATTNYNGATTQAVSFTISKASSTPTVSMSGYTYGGTKSTPSINNNTGNGSVTYYYNTTNSNSNGTAWTNVNSSTSLNAGTYYMYAVVGATDNYNGTTTSTTSFTISKASITPTVSMSGYTFAGTKSTPSISGNTGSGTVTYYYNTTNSNSNGTAWSNVSNSSSLAVGTYYMYAVVGSTTNYSGATTSTTSFTISGITRTVTFNKNVVSSLSTPSGCSASGNSVVCSCTTTGTNTSCNITSPTITATTNYSPLGFNTSSTATSSSWNSNTSKSIDANYTYNALQYRTVSVTYTIGDNVASIGSTGNSCTMYNSNTSCSVTLPSITANDNAEVLGWYNGSTRIGSANASYSISGNVSLTAKAKKYTASDLNYDNTKGYSTNNCTNVQCALEEINEMLK